MSDDNLFGDEHVRVYIDTDGERGHDWKGTQCLLLTTTGRKSGQPRVAPLIYAPDDDRFIIVASKGGADEPPAWYLNMEDDSEVEVQVKSDRFKATAHDAEGEERERLWTRMNEEWPDYTEYQQKTDREIPVVILERA
ncbi:MAG: nitroreductase family deazaflavin-dependent oxidoreductase [Solirubrobacteraceae bacterium]